MNRPDMRRTDHLRPAITRQRRPDGKFSLKFPGGLSDLQNLVLLTGDYGEWTEQPHGVWRYRSEDGAGLNWSSTKGTVWFDGPPGCRDRLERLINSALQLRPMRVAAVDRWR